MAELAQGASYLEGGAAVQPRADLIKEQCLLGPHQQLTCCVARRNLEMAQELASLTMLREASYYEQLGTAWVRSS